jgi:DNA polymerase-3 subunit gamma/tau
MYQAFYRKYRPQTFDDVYGQDHITSVLRYECANDNVSHAYLFCGSRGTGKTSCAKILAKAINCESPVNGNPCGKCASCRAIEEGRATDVVEMDAASNNGVDDIRILRDEVVYTPSMLKRRVYIIDEVHMLSTSAFNALLKTLEEPPEYVVFILATTEFHKLPATITSRCQRFDFRRISIEALSARLEYIAEKENITLAHDAAARIARIAEGGMRDAISLFEQCAAGGAAVDAACVAETLGLSGYDKLGSFAKAVAAKDLSALLEMIASTQSSSKDISVFWGEVASFWRDMMIMKVAADPGTYLDLTDPEKASLYEAARAFTMNQIAFQLDIIDETRRNMIRSPQMRRQIAELSLLRLISPEFDKSTDALLARISALEDKVALLEMGARPSAVTKDQPVSKEAVFTVQNETDPEPYGNSEDDGHFDTIDDVPFFEDGTDESEAVQSTGDAHEDSFSMFGDDSDDGMTEIPDPSVLIEKMGAKGEMYRTYLSKAKIETNAAGDTVRITVDSSFAKTFLGTKQATEAIGKASMLAKIVLSPPIIEICVDGGKSETANDKFVF